MQQMDQAEAMGEQLSDKHAVGTAIHWKTMTVRHYAMAHEQVRLGQVASGVLQAVNDRWELAQSWAVLQDGLLWAGRLDEALAMSPKIRSLVDEVGNFGAGMFEDMVSGFGAWISDGEIETFDAFGMRYRTVWAKVGPWARFGYVFSAYAHFWNGQWDSAEAGVVEGAEDFPDNFWTGMFRGWQFVIKAYSKHKDARAVLSAYDRYLPKPGEVAFTGNRLYLLCAIEGLTILGDRSQVSQLYQPVTEVIEDGFIVWATGLVECYAGIAAAAGEQWDLAELHFETALEQANDIPHRLAQPETRRWYAWMLLDRNNTGDRELARTLLTEAIHDYEKMDMPRHVDLANELLATAME